MAVHSDRLEHHINEHVREVSLDPLRWGLIPYWCENPKGGRRPINAKCEIHIGLGGPILAIRRGALWLGRRDAARPGSALRLLTDVADSTLVILRFGATMELGRSERTTMRPLWSYGVDGANTPDRKPR
jgi:hypothetical protein